MKNVFNRRNSRDGGAGTPVFRKTMRSDDFLMRATSTIERAYSTFSGIKETMNPRGYRYQWAPMGRIGTGIGSRLHRFGSLGYKGNKS